MRFAGMQQYQIDNVMRACEMLVDEVARYGMEVNDMKALLAEAWEEHFKEKAKLGAEHILRNGL